MVIARRPYGALVALLLPMLSSLGAATASAQVPDTIGFGARSQSLAGAVAADVDDASASFYNPGGLARSHALQLMFGYSSTSQALEISGLDSNMQRIAGMDVGIVAPLNFGSDYGISFGVALHLPDQGLSTTRSSLVDRPQWVLFDTRPHKIYLATSLAFRFTKYFNVGAGIAFQSPANLTLALRGTTDLADPDTNARLEHEFRGNLLSIRYPQIGFQVHPHERLSFGLTYRGALKVTSTIDATVSDSNTSILGLGDPIPIAFHLLSLGMNTYVPQQVVLAFAAHPIDTLRIGFDLTWLDWSAHPSLISNDTVSLAVQLPPGLNLNVPSSIVGRKSIPMYGHDRWVPRFSLEWTALHDAKRRVDVRAGYAYERAPFPPQTGETNFVTTDRHTFSAGAGIRLTDLKPTLSGGLGFNVYFAYFLLPEVASLKTSPVNPVGDYRAGGHQVAVGGNFEVLFQ